MRRSVAILGVVALLIPLLVEVGRGDLAAQEAGCGAGAEDGLILYRAYDEAGKLADPPLMLVDPTNTSHLPVDVPDPREVFAAPGCLALVKTADKQWYLVDGPTGEARLIEFEDPTVEMEYQPRASSRRYGVFAPNNYDAWNVGAMLDFTTGEVIDLFTPDPPQNAVTDVEFSPSGDYLVVAGFPQMGSEWGILLVPMTGAIPPRELSEQFGQFVSFDETEERVLYRAFPEDDTEQLIIEEIESGARTVVASISQETDTLLGGSFVPGQPDLVAVTLPERFSVIDVSGAEPVEVFGADGSFGGFAPALDGRRGIVYGDVALPIGDGLNPPEFETPTAHFVDLEAQTVTQLAGPAGEPVRTAGPVRGRWALLEMGDPDTAPFDLGALDMETGAVTWFFSTSAGSTIEWGQSDSSSDGQVLALATSVEGTSQQILVVDVERGEVMDLVGANSVSVDLSADGRWLSYSTLNRTDDIRTMELSVLDTTTGETTVIGPGLQPVWLHQ